MLTKEERSAIRARCMAVDKELVDNAFIKDERLSYKAKGILLYILSRPDDWEINESDIVNQSNDGISAVRTGMQELIKAEYIQRKQKRNDKNQFAGYEYAIHEKSPFYRMGGNSMNIKKGDQVVIVGSAEESEYKKCVFEVLSERKKTRKNRSIKERPRL